MLFVFCLSMARRTRPLLGRGDDNDNNNNNDNDHHHHHLNIHTISRHTNKPSGAVFIPRPLPPCLPDLGRGDDTVGNPHRGQISQFELFEFLLFLTLDKRFPVERFEATVSQSTGPSPPPLINNEINK